LDKSFEAPTPNLYVLEQLSRGELTVDEALERLASDSNKGEKQS